MKVIKISKGFEVLVDDDDFERLACFKWSLSTEGKNYYAVRVENGKRIKMHRKIMGFPVNKEVDHRDGNGLNNQKNNLRICTHQQNHMNEGLSKNSTSGFKGVTWNNSNKNWRAKIWLNGKTIDLGSYKEKEMAALAYDAKAKMLFGEFARVNF